MANELQTLIEGLNEDLAAELGTIIRYNYQASKAFGPGGSEIRELFRAEVQDELGHAAFLSDVIVDLGGEPTTQPQTFAKPDTLKEMLELDLEMEQQDIQNYQKRAKQAEAAGHPELMVPLEDMAADEGEHARELRRLLAGM